MKYATCFWLLFLLLGGAACSVHESDPQDLQDRPGNGEPPLLLQNIHLEEFGGEGKMLDLWSKSAQFERDDEKVYLHGVKAFWSSHRPGDGNGLTVNGREGQYDLKSQIALIKGDVTLSTSDGHTTYTDKVRYDHQKQQIEGRGDVRIEGPEGFTEGIGLFVELKQEVFVIRKKVRTLLNPSAIEKATTAEADIDR
jgi:LPS export ABC transporter protein LptC